MKGYFDFAIFDEAHKYKGGSTGQGNAMGALIKSSKKQLALTGTIAGGVAQDLFFLFYRLDPGLMKRKGFRWNEVMKFSELYGVVEKEYEMIENSDSSYNQMTRGKQIHTPRVKPGISPLIFTDFLLSNSVFLDISDLSKYLPPLKEFVVSIPLGDQERAVYESYQKVINEIKGLLREKGGKRLLGKLLQFSLSYLDKPFGEEAIMHPLDGSRVCTIDQHTEVWEKDHLMAKEKKLLEILKKELDEGRNCFVFCEYTGKGEKNITQRLKKIIEQNTGVKTCILESSTPEPLKREAWIHEQAEKNGIRVIITNPRCTETGVDFCWDHNGIRYNYPTIVFYQMGYSLFVIWQASRRHYRLNQKDECRTYYLCYAKTIQMMVIMIIAEKLVATSAIQGKFSSEGLAAMAEGVDTEVKLAQALLNQEEYGSEDSLQGMFNTLNQTFTDTSEDRVYEGCEPMKTVVELIGEEQYKKLSLKMNDIVIDQIIDDLLEDLMADLNFEMNPV